MNFLARVSNPPTDLEGAKKFRAAMLKTPLTKMFVWSLAISHLRRPRITSEHNLCLIRIKPLC